MTCWASTSSAPVRSGSTSKAFSAIASRAAWHSSISKRLAGTNRARLGSSSRWLARPIRCTMRAGALGAGELDDEVDVAPVDAEVERGGADHGPQLAARHRRLDLAPLFGGEGAVVQGDGQVVVVEPPQLLEGELGLEAGVDEDQRGLRPADLLVDLRHGVLGGVAGPGHAALRSAARRPPAARRRIRAPGRRPSRRCGESQRRISAGSSTVAERPTRRAAGANWARRARPRHSRSPRLDGQIAWTSSMIDAGQVLEIAPRAFPGAEQGQLLGRGEQDVGRLDPLALTPGDAGVAGAATRWRCSAPSGRPARSGCARRPPPAPSAAKCRGCAPRAACWPAGASPGRSGWAGIPPGSCRRRWARSAARDGHPAPCRSSPADGGEAASHGTRTSWRTARAERLSLRSAIDRPREDGPWKNPRSHAPTRADLPDPADRWSVPSRRAAAARASPLFTLGRPARQCSRYVSKPTA